MNAQQAWQAARGQLQMEMPKAAFDTWVRNAELVSYEDGSFMVGVPNAYARDWLESRLSNTVTQHLTDIMAEPQEVRFVLAQRDPDPVEPVRPAGTPAGSSRTAPGSAPPGMRQTFGARLSCHLPIASATASRASVYSSSAPAIAD